MIDSVSYVGSVQLKEPANVEFFGIFADASVVFGIAVKGHHKKTMHFLCMPDYRP